MKRKIEYIIVHCTAGNQNQSVFSLCRWFLNGRGWSEPGYHFIINKSGLVIPLEPLETVVNGAKGYNQNGIHVAWVGGVDSTGKPTDNRTIQQKASLQFLLNELHRKFPDAKIRGHRELPGVQKECPCFDVKTEFKNLREDEKE